MIHLLVSSASFPVESRGLLAQWSNVRYGNKSFSRFRCSRPPFSAVPCIVSGHSFFTGVAENHSVIKLGPIYAALGDKQQQLFLLPICHLYLMLFFEIGQYRYRWKWIGHALKHYRSRWDHLDIVFCRNVITTSGIRPPSWNFWVKVASDEVGICTSKNPLQNIGIATKMAWICFRC